MINWKKSILSEKKNISDAIKTIENSEIKMCFIVNNKKEFLGTVTDGDIRRSLIKNYTLNSSLRNTINYNAYSVDTKANKEKIKKRMKERKILYVPILDKKKKIIGIYNINDEERKKNKNLFFIFCGGKGERLKPITNFIPKPMIKIADKPLLEHIILRAKEDGFYNFLVSVFYKKEIIKKYFKNGKNLGVKISYVEEKKPLGTAGALGLIKKNNNLPILICNGDVLSKINFDSLVKYHNKNKSNFTVVTSEHNIQNPFGTIKLKKNKVIAFNEKPINKSTICTGIYVIDYKILSKIKKNIRLDMPDLIKNLILNKNKIFSYPIFESWIDIGTHENFNKAILKN
jgi:dTDP-glucose pyrophosphorylase